MKIDWRRRAQRQIGRKERLVVLWRGTGAEPQVLVLCATACDNPACDCADVRLSGSLETSRFDEVIRREGSYVLRRRGPAEPERRALVVTFTVEPRFGAIQVKDAPEGMAADLGAWVHQHLDDELLDFLYDTLFDAKRWARDVDGLRHGDWTWWEPSLHVPYDEAFPSDRTDGYVLDGQRYCAVLYHCVNPRCDCHEGHVSFARVADEGVSPTIGGAGLDVDQPVLPARPIFEEEEPGQRVTLERLWEMFRARHRDPAWLRGRVAALRSFGARKLHPWYAAQRRPAPPPKAPVRAGRNDPCPCGSGKKFKRCCGA